MIFKTRVCICTPDYSLGLWFVPPDYLSAKICIRMSPANYIRISLEHLYPYVTMDYSDPHITAHANYIRISQHMLSGYWWVIIM